MVTHPSANWEQYRWTSDKKDEALSTTELCVVLNTPVPDLLRLNDLWAVTLACLPQDRLVGLVVKASASRAEDPGLKSRLRRDFSGSGHTSDLKIGTPVATLPGTWRYRVRAGTGWPGVSILWLGEMESLVCNFYLSVAACKIVWADPSLRYTRMLLRR